MKNLLYRISLVIVITITAFALLFLNLSHAENREVDNSDKYILKSMTLLDVKANDFIYDPINDVVYASVPEIVGKNSHSVMVMNSENGTISKIINLESEPNLLAISQDGSVLYVALDKLESVQKINLISQTADTQFQLTDNVNIDNPRVFVSDMFVAQDDPNTLIALLKVRGISGDFGVRIYENGAQKASITSGFIDEIEPSETITKVYGLDSHTSGFVLHEIFLDDNGVSENIVTDYPSGTFEPYLGQFQDGLLYDYAGRVFNPQLKASMGRYTGVETIRGPFAINTETQTILFANENQNNEGKYSITLFDQLSFQQLASMNITPRFEGGIRPVKLEFISENKLLLLTDHIFLSEPQDLFLIEIDKLDQYAYLPTLLKNYPLIISAGSYPLTNKCTEIPIVQSGERLAKIDMCVTSVDVMSNGDMKFNISWTSYFFSNKINFLQKGADVGNINMNVRDNVGNRYDHFDVGDAAANTTYWYSDGETHTGWYLFPAAKLGATSFSFHDDDQQVIITNIELLK